MAQSELLDEKPVFAGNTLPSESYVEKALPSVLTPWDMTALFVIILFFITNVPNAIPYGAVGLTFWIIGGIAFFIPCAIATAQLAVMFPHEGSLYNWAHKAFGRYMSFFVGFCHWIPSTLLILATADLVISYLQGLNTSWLVEPWQQGALLIGLIALSGVMSVQRHRTMQNMVNVIVCLSLVAVGLIFIASIVWLATGHPSATSFNHLSDWMITWDPKTGGNISPFGVITLGYLGVNLPMNLGGEMISFNEVTRRRTIARHLLWGPLIVVVSYLLVTFAMLVVQGQKAAYVFFGMVTTVDMALGKFFGNITAVCIIATFVVAMTVYNYIFSRFLMVGSIDQRLPSSVGKLNRNRIPANAVLVQTLIAIGLVVLFFMVIPYVGILSGKPGDLALEVYYVGVAAATLIWAFATIFLFVAILRLYFRDPSTFHPHRLFPIPVLLTSSVVGLLTGLIAIVITLFNSWDPLINSTLWFEIVGSITLIGLIIGAIASMFTSSEAAWQEIERSSSMSTSK